MEGYANITRLLKPREFNVIGNEIIDNLGREIIFKGAITSINPNNQYLSEQAIQAMAEQGNNIVRLDLDQEDWLTSDSLKVKGSYKQKIDAAIRYAAQKNMAIILNLRQLATNSQQAYMVNLKMLRAWEEIASAYKDTGTVIFELFNESVGVNPYEWLNGKFGGHAGIQKLYTTVREAGANNLVIISGLDDLSLINEDFNVDGGDNIIYCAHSDSKQSNAKFPIIYFNGNHISTVKNSRAGCTDLKINSVVLPQAKKALAPILMKCLPISSQASLRYHKETVAKQCEVIIGNTLALCLELKDMHLLEDILFTALYEIQKVVQPSYSALDDLRTEFAAASMPTAKALRA